MIVFLRKMVGESHGEFTLKPVRVAGIIPKNTSCPEDSQVNSVIHGDLQKLIVKLTNQFWIRSKQQKKNWGSQF
jgi:hypothetical protein